MLHKRNASIKSNSVHRQSLSVGSSCPSIASSGHDLLSLPDGTALVENGEDSTQNTLRTHKSHTATAWPWWADADVLSTGDTSRHPQSSFFSMSVPPHCLLLLFFVSLAYLPPEWTPCWRRLYNVCLCVCVFIENYKGHFNVKNMLWMEKESSRNNFIRWRVEHQKVRAALAS